MNKEQWYQELLQYGKSVGYFHDSAFLDFENEKICFTDGSNMRHMKFSDWETYRIEGEMPQVAINTDLSYA